MYSSSNLGDMIVIMSPFLVMTVYPTLIHGWASVADIAPELSQR